MQEMSMKQSTTSKTTNSQSTLAMGCARLHSSSTLLQANCCIIGCVANKFDYLDLYLVFFRQFFLILILLNMLILIFAFTFASRDDLTG